jgi:hypothetical protein
VAVNSSIKFRLVLLLQMFVITEKIMKRPVLQNYFIIAPTCFCAFAPFVESLWVVLAKFILSKLYTAVDW